jgi:serine/threonine protein kinase
VFKRENPQNQYKILKRLSSGSFGQIYLAERKIDKQQLALKMLKPKTEK